MDISRVYDTILDFKVIKSYNRSMVPGLRERLSIVDLPPQQGVDAGLYPEPIPTFDQLLPVDYSSYTARDLEIFRAVAIRRPNTEFPLYMEQVLKESLGGNLHDGAFQAINPLHRYVQDFMRRWYGKLDHTYDSHMDVFDRSKLDTTDFLHVIRNFEIVSPGEFGNVVVKIGELTDLFLKIMSDEQIYPKFESRERLLLDYHQLMSYSVNTSRNLVMHEVNSNPSAVKAAKLGIHPFHGGIMFDTAAASLIGQPGYDRAKLTYVRAKMAHQIKNDLLGIAIDSRDGAANIFLGIAYENGEQDRIPGQVRVLSEEVAKDIPLYARHLAELIPSTYRHLRELQLALLSNTNLSDRLRQICLIPEN